MRIQEHLKLSTAASLVAMPFLKQDTWIPFIASIGIDIDHYLWYAVTHRSLRLREAVRFFQQADPPQTAAMKLFHQPLFLGLLLFLAIRFRSRLLALVLAGLLFHVGLDLIHNTQMRMLKQTLSEQAMYSCPACGCSEEKLQLHTLQVTNNLLERYHPKHFVVLCPACHERAHKPVSMR